MDIDWQALFGFDKSLFELFIRGTAVYLFLFVLFRFVMRREIGAIGVADVLLIVLIADASQNAMAAEYTTITEGIVVICTLVFWNMLFGWAGFHWRLFARFAEPPPCKTQARPIARSGTSANAPVPARSAGS